MSVPISYYINLAQQPERVAIGSLLQGSSSWAPMASKPTARTSGTVTTRLHLFDDSGSNASVPIRITATTIVLAVRKTPDAEDLIVLQTAWTQAGESGSEYYQADINWNVVPGTWNQGELEAATVVAELIIDGRPVAFPLSLSRGAYDEGAAVASPQLYVKTTASQGLTSQQKTNALTNLGGTATGISLVQAESAAAAATAIGLGSTSAVNFSSLLLGPSEDNAFAAQGTQAGIVTATIAGDAAATTFTFDATGLTVGMYAHDAFPSGTTIQSIGGTAPTNTVQLSAGKLTSGSTSVRFSTNSTPFPRVDLNYDGNTVFFVDHTGTGYFASTIIAGTVNAATFAGTILNLESDGGITQGGFTLTLGGNVSFGSTGRLLAGAATPKAAVTTLTGDPVTNAGTSITLADSDSGTILRCTAATAVTITVPTGLSSGFNVLVIQAGAGQITFTASGTTLNSFSALVKTAGQHAAASLIRVATNTFNLSGNLS